MAADRSAGLVSAGLQAGLAVVAQAFRPACREKHPRFCARALPSRLGMLPRRPRLTTFNYQGMRRYFLTFCTHRRREAFRDGTTVELVLTQFLSAAVEYRFTIHAYVFMPDHTHLLVEGT